ncbi:MULTISPECIES: hypothetical protein [Actinomadura]|uniref:Uncharacterized protein n=2 Tax=Actinomadura TaxID=1988 RepID=A0ABV4QD98_9ACTN
MHGEMPQRLAFVAVLDNDHLVRRIENLIPGATAFGAPSWFRLRVQI